MPGNFLDSNVLLYLIGSDSRKASRAEELLRQGGTVSIQVLNEIANVARRKLNLSWEKTKLLIADIDQFLEVIPLTRSVHNRGLDLAEQHGFAIYDAMIIASALEEDCDVVFTEDMHHGMRIDGRLTIVNPFLAAPL